MSEEKAVLISDLRPEGYGIIPLRVACCDELREVGERALRVWLVLACRANDKRGGWAWSITALCNDTGIDRRNLQRAVAKLQEYGLIVKEPGGGRASTFYRLTAPPSIVDPAYKPRQKSKKPAAKNAAPASAESAPDASAESAPTRHATAPTTKPTNQEPPYPPQAGGRLKTLYSRADRIKELTRERGIRPREAARFLEREERQLALWSHLAEGMAVAGIQTHDPGATVAHLRDCELRGWAMLDEVYGPAAAEVWRNLDGWIAEAVGEFGPWRVVSRWDGRRERATLWVPALPWTQLPGWMVLLGVDAGLRAAGLDLVGVLQRTARERFAP
jgi:hypothetical protein